VLLGILLSGHAGPQPHENEHHGQRS
jgi:hypothetical protein